MEKYGFTRRFLILSTVLLLFIAPLLGYGLYKIKYYANINKNGNQPELTPPERSKKDIEKIIQSKIQNNKTSTSPRVTSIRKDQNWWLTTQYEATGGTRSVILLGDFYTSADSIVVIAYPLRPIADYALAEEGVPFDLIDTMRDKP